MLESADRRVIMLALRADAGDHLRLVRPSRALADGDDGISVGLAATLASHSTDSADVVMLRGWGGQDFWDYMSRLKRLGKKVVLDVDHFFEPPPYDPRFREMSGWTPFPQLAAGLADHVVAGSQGLGSRLESYSSSVTVVRSHPVDAAPDPGNRLRLRAMFGLGEDDVVVAWAGNAFSLHDLRQIEDCLSWVLCAREQARLLCFGHETVSLFVPEGHMIMLPHLPYLQYLAHLDMVDIGIVPRDNTLFNECRSGKELLEYGTKGIPVIASSVAPFTDSAAAGAPLVLANDAVEWKAALLRLIDDRDLRVEFGQDLMHYVADPVAAAADVEKLRRLLAGE